MKDETGRRYDEEWAESNFNRELFIMKRSGERVPFDNTRIERAIMKANRDVSDPRGRLDYESVQQIADQIRREAETMNRDLSVEEIQDKVENAIMATGQFTLARLYITYRYKHNVDRVLTPLDKKIKGIIDVKVHDNGEVHGSNDEVRQENSNKNPTVLSVQRDYIAGEWCRDYSRKHLLPADVVQAHDNGLIHVHDTDYMPQQMHNCFDSSTRFITKDGIRQFSDFHDGDNVTVLTKDGTWEKATVHSYGEQKLYDVLLRSKDKEVTVTCTRNHRWILEDNTVTTELETGHILASLPNRDDRWTVADIKENASDNKVVWCVEEPKTKSFTLAYNIVTGNCCLINLEDMLQNGTCISGTYISKPRSFATAATVTSQVISQVASHQYGGQTITLAHIAPFVDISRKKIKKRLTEEMSANHVTITEDQLNAIVESEVLREVEAGCQTIQYQLITLQTTNGQAPFVTVFMYLNEVPEGQTREDLAMIIEIMLKQRLNGIPDENGHPITPAFPKLIYCLQEDNITEDSRYWYLTELAAKCTAKRLVPDYVSEKLALTLKGDVYPPMGCVDKNEVITYKHYETTYTESFERMWNRLAEYFMVKLQPNGKDFYMDLKHVEIYDQKIGFTPCYRIIKNHNDDWLRMTFTNGRAITCTKDHPFETENRGMVLAENLTENDIIKADKSSDFMPENQIHIHENRAWLYGFILCDSTYYDQLAASIAMTGENDIEDRFRSIIQSEFNLDTKTVERHRGVKGNYKDLKVIANPSDNAFIQLKIKLISMFEGKAKRDRHIPNEVFKWDKESRLAFMAGMIDADGYLNDTMTTTSVQIGSTNKELAIQQLLLAQTLGMPGTMYLNHYRANSRNHIRYRVEFKPTQELIDHLTCNKKISHTGNIKRKNASITLTNDVQLSSIEEIYEPGFSYDVTTESEHFTVSGIYSHNCRSFLTPDRFTEAEVGNVANARNYVEGKHKYYGRFNMGVTTVSLVDVACSSEGNEDLFWEILNERLELCHKALQARFEHLKGTPSDVAPIQWQHGALARLKPGEPIDKLLYNGYATISLGYAGLAECVYYMKGESHTQQAGKDFGLRVMQTLNDACAKWKAKENIDYSVYGTPKSKPRAA